MQNNGTSKDFIHGIRFFIFLMLMAVVGVFAGVICCKMGINLFSHSFFSAESFLKMREDKAFAGILFSSFGSTSAFVIVAFVLGFSAIAQPFEVIIPLLKGVMLGVLAAQIYMQSQQHGILICLCLVVPCGIVSMYAVVSSAREAVGLSNIILTNTLTLGHTSGLRETVKLYAVKFLVLEAVTAVSAAVDCLCTLVFVGRI